MNTRFVPLRLGDKIKSVFYKVFYGGVALILHMNDVEWEQKSYGFKWFELLFILQPMAIVG